MGKAANLAAIGSIAETSLGFRNRIINGDMRIDQRNGGASVTPTTSAYTLDRWQVVLTQASKVSVQQNAGSVTPPTGFSNYLGITSLAATSVGASDFFFVQQIVEGFNTSDFAFGSASAATVTLSFWVRSSLTGTFGGALYGASGTRSYAFTYTISAANTWEQKTVTIAGSTSGTWLTNNGGGIQVIFGLGVGSSFSQTAGSWQNTGNISATGATSVVGTNGATFYITGVQFEAGSVASPFERRDYGRELMMCQRYAYVWDSSEGGGSFAKVSIGFFSSTTNFKSLTYFPVKMRAAPTSVTASGSLNMFDGASNYTATAIAIDQAHPLTLMLEVTCSGATAYRPGTFQANNNNTAKIIVSAEL